MGAEFERLPNGIGTPQATGFAGVQDCEFAYADDGTIDTTDGVQDADWAARGLRLELLQHL